MGLLQEWFGFHWWNTRFFGLLFIFVFLLLPLSLCRRVGAFSKSKSPKTILFGLSLQSDDFYLFLFSVDRLAFSSAISFLLALLFVVISSVLAIIALLQGKTKNPRLFPELNNGGESFFNLFTASPVIVTAFTFHFNRKNTKKNRSFCSKSYTLILKLCSLQSIQ